jgi:uncharacterized protein
MRVDRGYQPLTTNRTTKEGIVKTSQPTQFSEMLAHSNKQHSISELEMQMKSIQEQGDRLARHMTIRELKQYRQLVKRFLEDTLKRGVGLKEVKSFDRRGRIKRHKLLEEVDEKLVLMGEELLETEEGRLQLLQTMGEIRGILINLLF